MTIDALKRTLLIVLAAASLSPSIATVTAKEKPLLMWIDGTANFKRLSTVDSIAYFLDKVKAVGFTDIVVDVKPITGEVLYTSRHAPVMREWDGYRRAREFDYLGTFVTEAHKRSLKIHASLNIFAGGNAMLQRGVAYTFRPHWSSVAYTDSGMVPVAWFKHQAAAMLNPADTSVQNHELRVLEEVVTRYPLDGVILDRVRYDDLHADFTPLSRWLFEIEIGKKLERFPEEIFEWGKTKDGSKRSKPGKYFLRWLEWRAGIIRDFIAQARTVVKKARPAIAFGDYTGAWYPIYYQAGANWASSTYDPSKTYKWASPGYKKTGYAELLDFLTTGHYYYEVSKGEPNAPRDRGAAKRPAGPAREAWQSVEGSCEMAREVVKNAAPVYGGLLVDKYGDDSAQFSKAVAMALKKSDGLMIFDMTHIILKDWWTPLQKGVAMGR